MTYWCEFLAHIDDGQAIKVNILKELIVTCV